jgi:hypothetical protein
MTQQQNNSLQTVRAQLEEIDAFDPMNIDISEFDFLENAIPSDGHVDINIASQLAAQYLRAADRMSTIISALVLHEQKMKDEKKRAFAKAVVLVKEENPKMAATIAQYKAELDDDYIAASEKSHEAEATRLFFKAKHESLLKGHHLMKDFVRGEKSHRNASGFSETIGSEGWGEKKW